MADVTAGPDGVQEGPQDGQNSLVGDSQAPDQGATASADETLLNKLRVEIQQAQQVSWGAVLQTMQVIREKMLNDKVPRTDDGLVRSLIGIGIALIKSNGGDDIKFAHAIVEEMWSQVTFAQPKKIIEASGANVHALKKPQR